MTIKHSINLSDTYSLDRIDLLKDLLFFDIKATGFSGDTSRLYLIGYIYHNDFGWRLIQWFADSRKSRKEPLAVFFTFMEHFKILVHFNEDGFDVPYLLKCCRHLDLPYNLARIKNVGICKKIKPYRKLLSLESTKQESIERFLGVARDDKYDEGQLIEVYREYLMIHESFPFDLLILRNEDDLKDMPSILPALGYADMVETPFSLESQRPFAYSDMIGNAYPFLSLTLKSPYATPAPPEYGSAPVSLEPSRDTPTCNITLFQGELKYFCPNYKGYCYLSVEDTAIYRGMGEHVDGDVRTKATVRAYYAKKQSLFLPQLGCLQSPVPMQEYKASLTHAEYEPEMLSSDGIADAYAKQILSCVNQTKEL